MRSILHTGGVALALALVAGAVPAAAQDNGGRFRGREAGEAAPAPQAPRPPEAAPPPVQAPPQTRQNWQGRGPEQRGFQGGQGRFDRGDRGERLRAQAQAGGRERDQVQWQGQRRQPGQDFRGRGNDGQFRNAEQRAQWQRDRAGQVQRDQFRRDQLQRDRGQYDQGQYDQGRYDRDRFGRGNDGRTGQYRRDQFRGDQYRRDQAGRDGRYDGRYAGGGGDRRDWNRGWHGDRRYDWNGYRARNRDAFRLGGYYAPYRGYAYRRVGVGFSLQPLFFGSSYWIGDPFQYRLPPAYGPYRWVRYYDDALLVNIYSGEVVDTVYDIFW